MQVSDDELEPIRQAFAGKRFPALDGLRLVAMLEVVRYHAGQTPFLDGVQCFFILSGFLFAALLDREFTRTGTIRLGAFYARRFMRIFPAFIAAIVATIAFKEMLGAPVDYAHAFASITCWANYYNVLHGHPPTGFSSFWTLAVEQQFYLLFPPFLLLCLHCGGRRAAIRLLIAVAGLSAGWRAFAAYGLGASNAYLYNAFENRIDQFAVGALAGLAITSTAMQRFVLLISRRGWYPLVTLLLLNVIDLPTYPAWQFGVAMTLATPLLACLTLQLIALHRHRLWSWLEHPWIRYGGTLSYSAYLYHHLGLALGHRVPHVGTLAGVVATLLLAALSYHLIEQPVQRSRKQSGGWARSEAKPPAERCREVVCQ